MNIFAVDVGTTAMKFGIYTTDLNNLFIATRWYSINLYERGKTDIEPEKWWKAFVECCQEATELFQPWV